MYKLCAVHEIPEPGSKGFPHTPKGPVFAVRHDGKTHVYANVCPHLSTNLEWQEDQFLDNDQQHIQCSVHGALFRMEDGECLAGPCEGDSLLAIAHTVNNGHIYLLDDLRDGKVTEVIATDD